ncbi:MBL fold metallo-hydrolase [Chlamydiales bacterium]|nr:MBL fold metallo-hydrolase [Chlamydiales bacterium]
MHNSSIDSVLFLGSGPALAVEESNFHSNMLIKTSENKRLLIDCGTDVKWSLHAQGLSFKDIDGVYISHLHSDHVGGLEWLAFNFYFNLRQKVPLYIEESLVDDLWDHVLVGGLSSIDDKKVTLDEFFDVHLIQHGSKFKWEEVEFQTVKTIHSIANHQILPSFGLFFEANNVNILITTDTRFLPDLFAPYFNQADIIFHDCECEERISGIHTRFTELVTLPTEIKQKMWLYHSTAENQPDCKKFGFKGFVKKGQIFNFKESELLK